MQSTITDDRFKTMGSDSETVRIESAARCQAESQTDAICRALTERIGEQRYRIWFKNSTRFTLDPPRGGDPNGYLKIGVANLFIAGWIENHFLHEISEAVRHAIGSNLKITFTIDSELSVNLGRPSIPGAKSPKRPDKQVSSLRQLARQTYGGQASRSLKLTLDTFVVGPPNELAYNAAKQVARQQQSPFNPLFIHGGYGLGKTHLLQGVCNEVAKNRPQTDWLYLSAEDFANQFVLALKTKRLEGFRQKIRQMDLLAIDDIHFLANKPSTQEEFLHTFNTINLAGKQIVLASDAHPKMISQLSEKLINRFISGMVVKIEPPDFQTRCEICRQYAARVRRENSKAVASLPRERTHDRTAPEASGQSLTGRAEGFPAPAGAGPVPESVIKYIAENLRGSVRELEGALLKVIAYSALQNEKITLAMAQAVLAEHLERCDPIVHIADIESAAATYFGTTTATMHSSKKDRTVSLARHFSMYLARKHTKMSSAEIGRFMGNKNHATVLLACKRIEDLITRNADLHWQSPAGNRVAKTRDVLARLEESVSA